MDARGKNSNLKRPLPMDDADQPPMEKKPRFPKGKKAKKGDDASTKFGDDDFIGKLMDPLLAATERTKRRNQIREEELLRSHENTSAEVNYEDSATFEDDGIQIEPFNLEQEREKGYFDANGNFVEFANQNEIKDAWLDSIDVDPKFAEVQQETIQEEDFQDLSSEDVGKIKRSIANLLQPEETIIQALKRLKGSSGDNRGRMTEGTKRLFDELTENAVKLMENGEYNVYHEPRETFVREAEGYERLARARDGILGSEDIFSDATENGVQSAIWDTIPTTSEANVSSSQAPPSGEQDELDMFGDDDESTEVKLQLDGTAVSSDSAPEQIIQPNPQDLDSGEAAGGELESDYVFDPSSGYYYSSSLGYYYDPASQLYCCATSGTWYAYDGNTGSYAAIPNVASTES